MRLVQAQNIGEYKVQQDEECVGTVQRENVAQRDQIFAKLVILAEAVAAVRTAARKMIYTN